jgi:hypothetical protein
MSAYLGCETTLRAYEIGDGTWAGKGSAVAGLFVGLFDLNPPSTIFTEIDVSNMAQASGSIKEMIQAGVTEFGQFNCQMDFDPTVDPFALLPDEEYWYEIEFNFLQDTPANGNITWHFKGVLLENAPQTPMDDRASTTLTFRCTSIVTVVNS